MLLGLDVRSQLRDLFEKEYREPVTIKLFSQSIGCESCRTAEILLRELVEVAGEDRLKYEVYSPLVEKEEAQKYGVDRVPTIVIEGDRDYGIRYIGLPAGLEFSTLVQGIIRVSQRRASLSQRTLEALKEIDLPLELKVFVTTACGYCPSAAITAWNFAIASDYIRATVIDSTENPDLAERFQVVGVPKIVVNDGLLEFVGAQPEDSFLGYLISAYRKLKGEGEKAS